MSAARNTAGPGSNEGAGARKVTITDVLVLLERERAPLPPGALSSLCNTSRTGNDIKPPSGNLADASVGERERRIACDARRLRLGFSTSWWIDSYGVTRCDDTLLRTARACGLRSGAAPLINISSRCRGNRGLDRLAWETPWGPTRGDVVVVRHHSTLTPNFLSLC